MRWKWRWWDRVAPCTARPLTGLRRPAQPYLLTYLMHAGYAVFLLPWAIMMAVLRHRERADAAAGLVQRRVACVTRHMLLLSFLFNLIGLGSSLTWYISLPQTSVSANTAIYNSSSALVFLMSVWLLRERPSLLKILSVLASIAVRGVASSRQQRRRRRATPRPVPSRPAARSTLRPIRARARHSGRSPPP